MGAGHIISRFLSASLALLSGSHAVVASEGMPTYRNFVLDVTGRTDIRVVERLRITKHRLGKVNFPSGRLVIVDPLTLFVLGNDPIQDVRFPSGEYPVDYFLFADRYGPTVAMAQLTLSDQPVASWKRLRNYTGVDAGLSSFMSLEAFDYLSIAYSKEGQARLGFSNYYDDVLADEMVGDSEDKIIHTPIGQENLQISIIRSGFGDGYYPNYAGLDITGKPARIVTTFGVLETALMPEGVDDPDEERLSKKQFEGVRRP